jgi:hypothetical protein
LHELKKYAQIVAVREDVDVVECIVRIHQSQGVEDGGEGIARLPHVVVVCGMKACVAWNVVGD